MEQLTDTVWVHGIVAHGYSMMAGVVLGHDRIFVFDTLDRPQAMAPVAELLDGLAAAAPRASRPSPPRE